jgi:hypothetical protein
MESEHKHNWDWQGICRVCYQSSTEFLEQVEEQRQVLRRRRDYWQDNGRPDLAETIQRQIDQLPVFRWTTSEVIVK